MRSDERKRPGHRCPCVRRGWGGVPATDTPGQAPGWPPTPYSPPTWAVAPAPGPARPVAQWQSPQTQGRAGPSVCGLQLERASPARPVVTHTAVIY